MLKIRLNRKGKKNKASFRVTVADSRRAPNGKFIEILGHYDPLTKEKSFNKERINYWISQGAQTSATINNFLVDAGIIKGEKVVVWKAKKKEGEKDTKPEASKTAAAVAPTVKAAESKPKEETKK